MLTTAHLPKQIGGRPGLIACWRAWRVFASVEEAFPYFTPWMPFAESCEFFGTASLVPAGQHAATRCGHRSSTGAEVFFKLLFELLFFPSGVSQHGFVPERLPS